MNTSWIGPRRVAVIPARPSFMSPSNWADRIPQRLFYDPAPNGDDCSVRAYFEAISYGKARFEADIFPEVVVASPTSCGNMTDEAIRTLPAGHSYERACVVFPTSQVPGDNCGGWAFGFGSLFPGTTNLRGWCFLAMDSPLGTWGMELLHVFTYFGDLYNPNNPAVPPPGNFDEMACNCGTHPSAVTKLHMGWLTAAEVPVVPRLASSQFTLHALALGLPAPPGRVVAIRIPAIVDPRPTHYFLAECRLPVDRFDRGTPGFSSGIPSAGVVVYEVDEVRPPGVFWMWLRTPTALSAGQQYSNPTENLVVEATAATWGGMQVSVRSTEPGECAALREQIAQLQAERAAAADDLGNAVGDAERDLARRALAAATRELKAAEQRARDLACSPA